MSSKKASPAVAALEKRIRGIIGDSCSSWNICESSNVLTDSAATLHNCLTSEEGPSPTAERLDTLSTTIHRCMIARENLTLPTEFEELDSLGSHQHDPPSWSEA